MALRDYRAEDENDYYGQPFDDADGFVSVWAGKRSLDEYPDELDLLQDLCGVGYYSLSENELGVASGPNDESILELISDMSYAGSYKDAAQRAADERGVGRAMWAVMQYNYAYDPARVKRPTSPDVVFLGVFPYS